MKLSGERVRRLEGGWIEGGWCGCLLQFLLEYSVMDYTAEETEGVSKHWGWTSILPLIFVIVMLSGLCGHSHKNIMGNQLCHHSHVHSPTEVIRDTLADIGVGQPFRHIGDHCG